jgi:dephospho-CoA kinase
MFLIGLTGGIAAGKSTVAKLWRELGGIEIDADQLARQVVEPGSTGLAKVVDQFGSQVLASDGSLDRSKLGQMIFDNPSQRRELEAIVHPLVQESAHSLIAAAPKDAMVIYNVPLLVEANVQLPFDTVVTVEAPVEVRLERLISSRGLTREEAEGRIRAQASATERANHADHILNSNQDLALLLNDARALWHRFEREANLGAD